MRSMNAMISIVLLTGSPSLAAEPTVRISCSHTSQASFDKAVALMDRRPTDARRMFQEMGRRDRDCAILFWGMAMSAANPEERQDASLDAIVTAVVAGANDDEWPRIFTLPLGVLEETASALLLAKRSPEPSRRSHCHVAAHERNDDPDDNQSGQR